MKTRNVLLFFLIIVYYAGLALALTPTISDPPSNPAASTGRPAAMNVAD
jgi:hypothetical protein